MNTTAGQILELLGDHRWKMATETGFTSDEFAQWFATSQSTSNRRIRELMAAGKIRYIGKQMRPNVIGEMIGRPTYAFNGPVVDQPVASCAPKSRKSGKERSAATGPSASAGKMA